MILFDVITENVIDPHVADEYLKTLADKLTNPEYRMWFERNARNYILNSYFDTKVADDDVEAPLPKNNTRSHSPRQYGVKDGKVIVNDEDLMKIPSYVDMGDEERKIKQEEERKKKEAEKKL